MQGFSPRAEHGGPVPPTPSECWTFAQMWPISVRQKIGVEHQPRWVRMCGEVHAQLAGREGKSPRAYRQLGKASLRKPANLCNSLSKRPQERSPMAQARQQTRMHTPRLIRKKDNNNCPLTKKSQLDRRTAG